MGIKTIIVVSVWLAFLNVYFVTCSFAGGFDNHFLGVRGMAMGYALAGISDDASATYYNPGGLVFLDKNVWHGEAYGYIGDSKCEYNASSIRDRSIEPYYIPGLFLSKTFDEWAFGFGCYIPYAGGGTAYDNFQGTPYDLETFAGWYSFTLSTAYQLRSNLSVGIGVSSYGGMLEMESFDPSSFKVVKSEYDGITGYGGHIGLMYKPTGELSIGLVARSRIEMEMDGTVKIAGTKMDSDVELTLPDSFTLGLGYQPQTNFTIGISVWYRRYSDMAELTFKTAGVKSELKTYFQDCWMVGVGAEYQISNKLNLMAGLKYDQSATEKKGLNPAFCDVDLLIPSIGMGYDITDSTELNIGTSVGFGDEEYHSQKFKKLNRLIYLGIRFKSFDVSDSTHTDS